MKLAHVLAITRKQFSGLRHDPRTLALMVLAPVMAMLIFGFAFGSSPQHIPFVVSVQQPSQLSRQFTNQLDRTVLDISYQPSSVQATRMVRDGEAVGALIIPDPSVKEPAVSGVFGSMPATLWLDTTNQQLASAVTMAVSSASQHAIPQLNVRPPVTIHIQYAFAKAKNAKYIDYFVPGIMAFAITLFTTLLTLLAFVDERSLGTLDRLRMTPVTNTEIVLGYELAFGIIATIQGLLILGVAMVVYHILVVGSLWLAMALVVLTAIDAQAIGIVISAAAQRESQAVQFLPFIIFPVFLLSGIFVPVQSLPSWLQPFSYILAPTWSIAGLRDVLLRGWGLDRIWLHMLLLLAFAVVFTGLAIIGLRRNSLH